MVVQAFVWRKQWDGERLGKGEGGAPVGVLVVRGEVHCTETSKLLHGLQPLIPKWPLMVTHWKWPWCWERSKAGGEGDDRGWDGWMASPTPWTWVWVNSGSWWTGRPGVLQSMGSQRVGHNWVTELNFVLWKYLAVFWQTTFEISTELTQAACVNWLPFFRNMSQSISYIF